MPPAVRKPTTLASRLGEHPFAIAVFNDNRAFMQAAAAAAPASAAKAWVERELTESEWHVQTCGFALSHYIGLITQLAQIPAYIKQYHRTSSLAARNVTRASDVTYHLENFLVRTQSLQDRAVQLCSSVLHTGLDRRSVAYMAMVRNIRVKASGLDTPLKDINKLCHKYTQTRNQVIHHHGLLDDELRKIELLLMGSRVMDRERRGAIASSYRFLVGDLAARKCVEFDDFTRAAIDLSASLFTALQVQYTRMRARLSVA